MKKLLIICGLLFSVVTFANAQGQGGQGGGTPEERMKKQVDQLVEKLKLTDEQKTKTTAIFTAQGAAMAKMREEMQAGGDRAAMMEKRQKLTAETQAKITEILTDDQKKAYKTMLDEQKAEMEKRMKERAAGGGNGK